MRRLACVTMLPMLWTWLCPAQIPPGNPVVRILVQNQPPPSIPVQLNQPAIAWEGATAILSADVQGTAPLTFQWLRNGAFIEAATNATLVLSALERADDAAYSVTVTNSAGRARSDPAQLLVSNVKPAAYMSLLVNAPTGGVLQIEYADSLASNALWRPLVGVTSSVAPWVIVDPTPADIGQRFYKTPIAQGLVARSRPGWLYSDAAGSSHAIEFIEPQAGSTNWRTLQLLTLPSSPYLFVDMTAHGQSRSYRTTVLESPVGRRIGRLVSAITWVLPPAVYTNLIPSDRQALATLGIALNDLKYTLEFPTNPLPGYWIAVGNQRAMTDSNGDFQIDVPAGVTNGFAVRSRDTRTAQAEATFSATQLASSGQVPIPIVVRYLHEGILNMDAPPSTTPGFAAIRLASAPVCGNPCLRIHNLVPCCLDYDGLVNDGCKYADAPASLPQKLIRYLGSTCYHLVNEGLCANEFNAHTTGPIQVLSGPSCFDNHKYRNCQNIVKTDLSISAGTTTLRCGETMELTIHNNTWANETGLSLEPLLPTGSPGTLAGHGLSAWWWPGTFTLLHYDDAANLPQHLEDQVIQYTAPTLEELAPSGGTPMIRLTARAGGETRTLDITVQCGCGSNMVFIPAGTFIMGSPTGEPARSDDEGPQTVVTIKHGFCIGKYEVTQGEYLAVRGSNPSWFHGVRNDTDPSCNGCFRNIDYGTDLNRPVEQVNWFDCVAYCALLTSREQAAGRLPEGYVYRLPTEAEWEYACRAGTTTPFHYGGELRSGMANFAGICEYPPGSDPHEQQTRCHRNPAGINLYRTTAVGGYGPNAWNLYDMHGNVEEWCQDWYGPYPGGSTTDPQGPSSGQCRVSRGASTRHGANACRSASRGCDQPSVRALLNGFRIVLARSAP